MHSPTLLIMATILMGIIATVLFAVRHFSRRIPGLGYWALSFLCGFLLGVSLLTRTHTSEMVSVIAAQSLTFLVAYLYFTGVRAYLGMRPIPHAYAACAVVALIGVASYFTVVQPSPGLRFGLVSTAAGALLLLASRTIARGELRQFPARHFVALVSGGHGAFLLVRPWLFGLGSEGVFDTEHVIVVSQFIVLESIVAMVLMAFGALMLVNEQITIELRRLAEIDPLTDVFNRRSFLVLLDKAVSLAQRASSPLSVLAIDLDHFKRVNDTWGHRTGDNALRHFVSIATSCLRNGDVMGRLGGEEFAIFLPNTGIDDAAAAAERLRAQIAAQPVVDEHLPIVLSVSIGVTLHVRGESPEIALHRADAAMYLAKNKGRNRVEVLKASYDAPATT